MKIFLANILQPGRTGGGFTWIDNMRKAFGDMITDNYDEATVYIIPGATMVNRADVIRAKADGKKTILRVDNVLRSSRNRGTGMPRLFDFAQMCDAVVYQSTWARDFLKPFLKQDGRVILNSADEKIFKPDGPTRPKQGEPQYLYSRSSRDEGKNWISAWYFFQEVALKNSKAHLWIHGHFGSENEEWKFDFFGGAEERYAFRGFVETPEEMAEIYRSCDQIIIPFINEACSNTLIEAIISGTLITHLYNIRDKHNHHMSGGAREICKKFIDNGREYFYLDRMKREYLELFKSL